MVLAVALFMEQMDSTVIATSLPAIAADIGAEPISLKLALTAYFVALAIFVPLSGWMADRFGARNIFRLAIGIFILGSICCAMSDSLLTFVLSRFLQGIGGSMMTPIARLVLVRATPRNELVGAMAWLTVPALLGPLTGPPIGGFLTTFASWHWIFLINVPIGLIGILLVTFVLKGMNERDARPIDLPGLILSGITFAGIIFGFSVISLPAIPIAAGFAAIVIGMVSGFLYWRHAKRTAHPILDPRLFRRPLFRNAIIGGSFFRIGIGAFPFLMPLMLQLSFGMTPFESGMTTFVTALGAIASKFWTEGLFARFGFQRTLMVCALLGCLTLAANSLFAPDMPRWLLMAALVMGGLTRSFFFTGVNALAFSDLAESESSQATAINSVAQQLSIAAGVAVAGAALEISSTLNGREINLSDFHTAWLVVAGLAGLSLLTFLRMPRNAGSEVSGHQIRPVNSGRSTDP
ncbi:MFS transporter [Devosia sp.]|uniref:MFS transporter n=1 Tax=Devosia sp. TaxID=1871048 RepID=UPI003A94B63F